MVNQQSTFRFKNELEPMQKIYKCEDERCPQLQTSEHLTAMEIMQNLYKKLLQNLYKKLLQECLQNFFKFTS